MTHVRYATLIDMVQKDRDWAVLAMLGQHTVAEQQDIIEGLFLAAAMHHDDDVALRYFGYLGKVMDDREVIPLLGGKDNREVMNHQAVTDAKQTALTKRCTKVMELWEKIPADTTRQSWELYTENEGRPITIPAPTLLKTKIAMLDECVRQWSSSADEKWSDQVLDFLTDIKVCFEEDEKCVCDAFEKRSAEPLKLLRGFLRVVTKISGGFGRRNVKPRIAQILVRNWAMQLNVKDVATVLGTVAPVVEFPEARQFLQQTAVQLAECEKQIKPLADAILGFYDTTFDDVMKGQKQSTLFGY